MTQYAGVSPERWARFEPWKQIVQVGLEMHRARPFLNDEGKPRANLCYERALQLADLTAQVSSSLSLRKELRLWRELVAGLSSNPAADLRTHRLATRVLLQLDPIAAEQVQSLDL